MLELPDRKFVISPGRRQLVPLWIGLFGPSGGGKTFSALRLAKGISQAQGGPIYGIDTEAKRMLHYADQFEFQHMEFSEPFGSLDYLAAIQAVLANNQTGKRPTVIVDSMSHEHEGPGGMIDLHDQIATAMATNNGQFDQRKYERIKMLAWTKPKAYRRALINGMLRLDANFILCFRAKESSVPVQKVEQGSGGRSYTKTEVVFQGFVPIGGDDFVYECTLAALLMPGARGVPTWSSDLVGERRMIKLPEQFKSLPDLGERQLDEDVGQQLAAWADNTEARRTGEAPGPDPASGKPSPEQRAADWVDWFVAELDLRETVGEVTSFETSHTETLVKMRGRFPHLHTRATDAVRTRMTVIDMGE